MKVQTAGILALAAWALLTAACPNPITTAAVNEMVDDRSPALAISSPTEGSTYAQTVTVQGTATDNGKVRTVSWSISGTLGLLASGQLTAAQLGSGGAFSFQFTTVTFNGPIVVRVAAEDWNDNRADAAVTLQYPGSSVSSFTATPGNKQVHLSWEAVTGASSYTVYYTSNGTLPTETYGQSLTLAGTSADLTGLQNGAPHIFLLKANLAAGGAYYSGYVTTIPLSTMTLAPLVTGGYREIRLEWAEIAATSQFEVLRSSSAAGPFVNYTGTLTGTSFVDTGVSDGQWYYYKVRPALAGSIESAANAGQTIQTPPTSDAGIVSLNTPSPANKVKVSGSYAYVAAGASGLLVVDISNPSNPSIVGSVATTNARDVDLYDYGGGVKYAFVADGAGKLRAINVTNPAAPVIAGTYTGTISDAVVVSAPAGSSRAFVMDATGNSITAVNIAAPASMVVVGLPLVFSATYQMIDVDVANDSGRNSLYISTHNTSSNINYLWQYYLIGTTYSSGGSLTDTNYDPKYVTVGASYVYLLSQAHAFLEPPPPYEVIVASRYPSALAKVGETGSANGDIADIRGPVTVGSKQYVYAADGRGLQVVDVTTAASPALTDFWNTPGASGGVASNGSFAFVASGGLGFQTVDLALPSNPSVAGTQASYALTDLALRGQYVYAASTAGARLQIYNVATPSSPSLVSGGNLTVTGATGVALSGPYAFVTAGSNGLKVVDVSNVASPVQVGSAPVISGTLSRIAVKGDYAYVAGSTGIQVYDISDPTAPFGMGFFDTQGVGGMHDVVLKGHYAYAVEGAYFQPNNLWIIDVSNPSLPALADRKSVGVTINHVSLSGDYAYVTDNFSGGPGLYAVNINPSSAAYLTSYGPCDTNAATGAPAGVVAFGNYAYVVDTASGLAVVDISTPSTLSGSDLLRTLDWASSTPENIVLAAKYAYVADTTAGLKVIKLFP
jgi:hypothetical protein